MDYCIISGSSDLWLFETDKSSLSYSFVLSPIPIANIQKAHGTVDKHGHVHLFLRNQANDCIYAIWDHNTWKREPLPFSDWTHLYTYIDPENVIYIMFANAAGIYITSSTALTEFNEISVTDDNTTVSPLFFIANESEIAIGWTNNAFTNLTLTTVCRETGHILTDKTLLKSDTYTICKHWMLDDSIILLLVNTALQSGNLILKKISLKTWSFCEESLRSLTYDKTASFSLLKDHSSLLLLISAAGALHYIYSFDAGEKWASPRKSAFFAPASIQDVLTSNSCPSAYVCVKKIKGCHLHHPLIMNLPEIYSILEKTKDPITADNPSPVPNPKDKFRDNIIKSPKIQKR